MILLCAEAEQTSRVPRRQCFAFYDDGSFIMGIRSERCNRCLASPRSSDSRAASAAAIASSSASTFVLLLRLRSLALAEPSLICPHFGPRQQPSFKATERISSAAPATGRRYDRGA